MSKAHSELDKEGKLDRKERTSKAQVSRQRQNTKTSDGKDRGNDGATGNDGHERAVVRTEISETSP